MNNSIKFRPYYKLKITGSIHTGSGSSFITTPITNLNAIVDGIPIQDAVTNISIPITPSYYTGIMCSGPTMIHFLIENDSIIQTFSSLNIESSNGSRKAIITPDIISGTDDPLNIDPIKIYESPCIQSIIFIS